MLISFQRPDDKRAKGKEDVMEGKALVLVPVVIGGGVLAMLYALSMLIPG